MENEKFINNTFCPNSYFYLNSQYASDSWKRVFTLRHVSRIFHIRRCLLKYFDEIKDCVMNSESLILFVIFVELNLKIISI